MKIKFRRRRSKFKRRQKLKRIKKGGGLWDNFKKSWNAVFF